MSAPSPAPSRPRIVEYAFWLLVVGAVLLIGGGLLAVTLSFDSVRAAAPSSISDQNLNSYLQLHRGAGVGCVLVGAGLGFLAGRARSGDPRFRRATIGLAVAVVVVVGAMAVFVGIHVLALLSLLPIIVGMLLLTRPAATAWFEESAQV
jgi:hypothetical protein